MFTKGMNGGGPNQFGGMFGMSHLQLTNGNTAAP
jgi:hypothetical protein